MARYMTVYQCDVVGRRDLSGLCHLPGIRDDVEALLCERFHDARADSLRGAGHDRCLPLAVHGCLPQEGLRGHGQAIMASNQVDATDAFTSNRSVRGYSISSIL